MEEDFDGEFDDWEDDSYEDEEEEEEQPETSPPDINFEELEDFADDIREIIEYNQKQIDFANRELNEVEKSAFLDNEIIDTENVIKEVKNMLEKRHNIEDTLCEMNPGSATAWALIDKQQKREMSLKQRMTLRLAGIDNERLSDFTDDIAHLIEDTINSRQRNLRKDNKEILKHLSYSEREELIDRLLEYGHIDQYQYNYLKTEFL